MRNKHTKGRAAEEGVGLRQKTDERDESVSTVNGEKRTDRRKKRVRERKKNDQERPRKVT